MQTDLLENAKLATWGVGQSAAKEIRLGEELLEKNVSEFLGAMSVLWLRIDDEPTAKSDRSYLEKNSIGLLSGPTGPIDLPSESWLGRKSTSQEIRFSGLWNVDYVTWRYDRRFLGILERYVNITLGVEPVPATSIAPADWFEIKRAPQVRQIDQAVLFEDNEDGG